MRSLLLVKYLINLKGFCCCDFFFLFFVRIQSKSDTSRLFIQIFLKLEGVESCGNLRLTEILRFHLCEMVEFREEVCVTALVSFGNVVAYLLPSQSGSFTKRLGLAFPFRILIQCGAGDAHPL